MQYSFERQLEYEDVTKTLVRDIAALSLMLYPPAKYSEAKRSNLIFKAIAFYYANLSKLLKQSMASTDLRKLSRVIGSRMGEALFHLGGWEYTSNGLQQTEHNNFFDQAEAQIKKGTTVGLILKTALSRKCSLQEAATSYDNDYIIAFGSRNGFPTEKQILKINPKSFLVNEWQEFKTVAHLWCALSDSTNCVIYLDSTPFFEYDNYVAKGSFSSQLAPRGFDGFCKVAELYLKSGSEFVPPKSSFSILNWEAALRLAASYDFCYPL